MISQVWNCIYMFNVYKASFVIFLYIEGFLFTRIGGTEDEYRKS